jgi:hypothetical protein
MAGSVERYFSDLPDPRSRGGQRHNLTDVLTIAICAVICGADGWTEVQHFGRAKEKWFRTFLALPHGIPSHDIFGRVFAALDPEAFERCFQSWMQAFGRRLRAPAPPGGVPNASAADLDAGRRGASSR